MDRREWVALTCALALGALIGYIDSRPTWDDAGVTAGALVVSGVLLGATARRRPWLIALAVGAWIPAYAILHGQNYGSLLVLAFAFAGAYAGTAIRRVLTA